jgi:uncharacterized protein (DUF169 family)
MQCAILAVRFLPGAYMPNWKELENLFAARLKMTRRPVAITFLDKEPADIEKFSGSEPAGCSFWRLAAAGRKFYTVPADHFNCAVGAYTHHIQLPPERERETETMLGMMFSLGYVRPEEVPGIPRLAEEPAAIVFAPLGDAPVAPSVVLFTCSTASAMLLNEAATRAGASSTVPLLGRPSCMALPAAMQHGTVTSLACVGNRVYTGLAEGELYVVVPGPKLGSVAEALEVISMANATLEDFARGRQVSLSTA